MIEDVLNYFPSHLSNILKENTNNKMLEEIRIRIYQNIILKFNNEEKIINYQTTSEDILKILQRICENSIYTYQKEICEGYITLKGGHRIGITGDCVFESRTNY